MNPRKRVISSCMPCYTRKQKCNREYPCNHCVRRHCTEDCVYYSATTTTTTSSISTTSQTSSPGALPESRTEERPREIPKERARQPRGPRDDWNAYASSVMATVPWSGLSLAESFGYFEHSRSNSLALIQNLGLNCAPTSSPAQSAALLPEAADEVYRQMERMPDRHIVDFLVQYFLSEINWMDQIVHAPWFLAKYQAWWSLERLTLVADVDFATLVLHICAYALQFLPSPGYTLDKIRGVLLADVRSMCDEAAENLEAISAAAESRGSLVRIQYLMFHAHLAQMEGRTSRYLETLSRAMQMAQDLGMHCDEAASGSSSNGGGADETHREIERRTFCNLYVWDSLLSRQLDRCPFLQGSLRSENRPRLHPLPWSGGGGGAGEGRGNGEPSAVDAPDPFAERLLQADLADFWRRFGPMHGAGYDVIAAEERYDRFCREYLFQLPPICALANPDETWDKRFPKLPLQRKLLHTAIYESICWNFRPLLLRPPEPLPAYKSVVLSWQRKKLAAAALQALDSVAQLHALLGGCHTRLVTIIFSTFDAAVILVSLSANPAFLEECSQQHVPPPDTLKMDPLHAGLSGVTPVGCLEAVGSALKRLQMLAEVSVLAEIGANTLAQLLSKVCELGARGKTAMQNEELGNTAVTTTCTTTAAAHLTATAADAAAAADSSQGCPWLPGSLADLRPESGFPSINVAPVGGAIASWPSFNPSGIYSHEGFMEEYWIGQTTNSD